MMVSAIEDDDPDGVVDAASTSGSSARITFSGSISSDARKAIDKFKSENPAVELSLKTSQGQARLCAFLEK